MSEPRNEKLIMLTIVASLILAFIVNYLAAIIYPPDFSGEFPIYSREWALTLQIAGALLIIALTVIAMKAEEEKQILAAAGFTAIAISNGINFMNLFDISTITTFDQFEDQYRITMSSNFLLIPATILIASYDRFKRWVRYFTALSMTPFFIVSVMFVGGVRDYHLLEQIFIVGIVCLTLDWLFWAYNIYINYRLDHKD